MSKFLPLGSILLSLLVAGLSSAQSPTRSGGLISGIVHSAEGAPLPSASVVLRRSTDTTVVAGSISAANGAFRIEGVAPDTYLVEVSHLGYRTETRSGVRITGSADRVHLGIIRLEASAIALEAVEVSAERPAVVILPDRNVYSTRDLPAAVGGTATDVLRSVPELEVSVEGRVTTRGATPRIHINGRPAPMQGEALTRFLEQLPAERIDRIEVISNPSARHEAEGQGGIVNIVMKEGTGLGLSGSIAVNAGTRNQRGGSGSISFQQGRLTLFGGASASFFGNEVETSDLRQNLNVQPTTYIRQDSRNRNSGGFASVDLTAEVKVGLRGTFWTEFGIGRNASDSEGLTAYAHLDHLQNPTQRYDRVNAADLRGLFGSALVGYRSVVEPERSEWSFELRRNFNGDDNGTESGRYWLSPEGAALGLAPELTSIAGGEDQNDLSLEAHLMRPWRETGQVEVGYRGSSRNMEDRFRMLVNAPRDPSADQVSVGDFRYRERIHAGFVTANRQIGRFGVQLGIRAEQAERRTSLPLTGESFETSYRSLFPSVNISTGIGVGGQVRLSYSRRVDRPWAGILNPVTPVLDPLHLSVGNPYLMPQYTHTLSVAVSRTGPMGTLQISPYYRRTVDSWDQVRIVDEAGVSTVTWQNLATITSYGGQITASVTQLGPVSGFVSVSGYREVRDASNLWEDFSGSSMRFSASSNFSIRATSALNLQGSVNYIPARNVPQGRFSPMVFSTLGARLRLWDGRGLINFSVVDPFELQRFTFTTRDRTHVQTGSSTFGARRATLSISYSFGRPPESNRRDSPPEEREQQDDTRRIR